MVVYTSIPCPRDNGLAGLFRRSERVRDGQNIIYWQLSKELMRNVLKLAIAASSMMLSAQTPRPTSPPFDASHINMHQQPPEGFAVRAGRLFDPRTGTNLMNQVIVIKADRIVDVGPADRIKIPQGVEVIDLSRATVLPGLIDRHVHLMQDPFPNDGRAAYSGLTNALQNLNAGFTTLQDMGSQYTYAIVELRDAINKGWVPGPRLQVAGPADRTTRGIVLSPLRRSSRRSAEALEQTRGNLLTRSIRRRRRGKLCASARITVSIGSRFTIPRITKAADIPTLRVPAHSCRTAR